MFNRFEKAYCLALLNLKKKDYRSALENFNLAAGTFQKDKEFNLIWKSTELLIEVKKKLAETDDEMIELEEVL